MATQTFTNSPLVVYTKYAATSYGNRTKNIDTISPHVMAGPMSVESCGAMFAKPARKASSNYGIGPDGRIALYLDERVASCCTSSQSNDQRAVTIEIASSSVDPYEVTNAAYQSTINLMEDICRRNNIKKLVWSTSKANRVNHANGCNITVHRDYAAKACPGNWLYARLGNIAQEVNRRLGVAGSSVIDTTATNPKVGDVVTFHGTMHYSNSGAAIGVPCRSGKATITRIVSGAKHPYHLIAVSGGGSNVYGWVDAGTFQTATGAVATTSTSNHTLPYVVRVTTSNLNIRKDPNTNSAVVGSIKDKGLYTIIAESSGAGATKWGKLKSGAGWISLDYAVKQ